MIEDLRRGVAERAGAVLASDRDGAGREGKVTLALLEGILLFAPPEEEFGNEGPGGERQKHGLRDVHDLIDVKMFLPAPYGLVKERREQRSGYVTIGPAPEPELPQRSSAAATAEREEGNGQVDLEAEDDRPAQNFWTDPPGYVDDIVWPRYVRDHAWLLRPEQETEPWPTTNDDDELVRRIGQGVNVRMDAGVSVAPGQGGLSMADTLKWAVEQVLKHLEQGTQL